MGSPPAAVAAAVAVLLTAGLLTLILAGRDTSAYLLWAGGPVISGLVGLVLAARVKSVAASVAVVRHQTNSLLTSRLDRLDSEIGEVGSSSTASAPGDSQDIPVESSVPHDRDDTLGATR